MTRESDLAYWINEREMMRLRKEELNLTPYSTDPLMANVRYCNIRREDDKVTRWVKKHWRDPLKDHPKLVLAMVAARMINWPPTLDVIGPPIGSFHQWATLAKGKIRQGASNGYKMWTSAYTISTCGRAMLKEDYVFDHVLAQVAGTRWEYGTSDLADAFRELTSIDGLGSFLAAQVVADLKNVEGHPLNTAEDWWSWSAPGPGSLRGLEAFFGRKITPSYYERAINECYNLTSPLFAKYVGTLHMQDFQNALCEFSKYMRMKEGDGRARNGYSPERRADYHV